VTTSAESVAQKYFKGKLKGYQLKLHIDENLQPGSQPVRRISLSRRAKVTEKLEELLKLGVIEK